MLLCSSLATAQEADELGGSGAELSVIARAEYLSGDDPLGNSSLYTLLEGNISDNLSYSVCNHWLSSEPGALYANTLRSDDVNWLDWAYLTYSFGSVELSLGKDMLVWGTYEMDEYDFDVHIPMATSIWNAVPVYQWGVRASWLPLEGLSLDFRLASSPYSEHPFGEGMLSYGIRARYEKEEAFGGMDSYNILGMGHGHYRKVLSAGAQAYVGDARIVADFNNKVGDCDFIMLDGFTTTLMGIVPFAEDKFDLLAKAGYEQISSGNLEDVSGILGLHWRPVEMLRVHVLGGYRWGDIAPGPVINAGLTCNLSFGL